MTPPRAVRSALALLFLLLFLASVGLRIWAAGAAAATVGPTHLAAGPEAVYVHADRELLVLSPDGALRARQALASLGLDDVPIDLQRLADGQLLVAGQRPASLRRCEPSTWTCRALAPQATARLAAQFKVRVAGDALWIADFAASQVWRVPLAGGAPEAVLPAGALDRPNDLAFDADGRLWVADSGHRRLAVFAPAAERTWALVYSLDAGRPPAAPGNDWPMMLAAGADGRWWVTQPEPQGGAGELIGYHPERGAEIRAALPAGADATDVVRLDGDLLVSDMAGFRLYRVAAGSGAVTEFGDAAVRALLAGAEARRNRHQRLAAAALVAIVAFAVLMLAAAVWATPRGQRFTRAEVAPPLAAAGTPAPALRAPYWLQRNPAVERQLRWLAPASYLLSLLPVGLLVALYFLFPVPPERADEPQWRAQREQLQRLLTVSIVVFGGLPLLVSISARPMRRRLGTDGRQLLVRYEDGRERAFLPERLVYGDRLILHQGEAFAVQTGKRQPLYASGEIDTYIAPLLQRARRLDRPAMLRHLLVHREPALVAMLVYVLVVAAVLVATGVWRELLPGD